MSHTQSETHTVYSEYYTSNLINYIVVYLIGISIITTYKLFPHSQGADNDSHFAEFYLITQSERIVNGELNLKHKIGPR